MYSLALVMSARDGGLAGFGGSGTPAPLRDGVGAAMVEQLKLPSSSLLLDFHNGDSGEHFLMLIAEWTLKIILDADTLQRPVTIYLHVTAKCGKAAIQNAHGEPRVSLSQFVPHAKSHPIVYTLTSSDYFTNLS